MNEKKLRYVYLVVGNLISAYSTIYILRPNELMTGGITGLSRVFEVVIKDAFYLSPLMEQYLYSIIYYILALIVLLLALVFLGRQEGLRILFLSLVYPLLLFFFTFLNLDPLLITVKTTSGDSFYDIFLPTVIYGVLSGVGTGLILRSKYTSGGSDTIAKIIYRKALPFVNYSHVLLIVDAIIILSGLFVFDIRIVFYAMITKYINTRTVDMIVLGIGNNRVKMEIVSTKVDQIIPFIQNSIHRGVTIVDVEGGYSKSKLRQIITVCSTRESLRIKNFIASIDEDAFVYVIPSSTVWGKGFKNIHHDDLS